MIQEGTLYEDMDGMDQSLPILFHRYHLSNRKGYDRFPSHWHESIELLFFVNGEAEIQCSSDRMEVKNGDLIVVNSNELHQGRCISESVDYYCIIFSPALFQGRYIDVCQAKYLSPISQNQILFENKIGGDQKIAEYIHSFVLEYESKKVGYEMAVKAIACQILVALLRNHVRTTLTEKEYSKRMRDLNRFNLVLNYLEMHYSEKTSIDRLCAISNISRYYFCRKFRKIIGKTPMQYLNELRIGKAEAMLKNGGVNITQAAMACGFNDANYFSRLFKKYEKIPPSSMIKENVITHV